MGSVTGRVLARWRPTGRIAVGLVAVGLLSLASCIIADPPPQIGTAIAANGKATVSWEVPAGDNGLTITSYVVTPYIGTAAQAPVSFSAAARRGTVTGLSNGVTYTFSVQGINARGPRDRPFDALERGHPVRGCRRQRVDR